jgi:hypothetical protein
VADDYRIYRLDRARLILDVEWISAATDDEALAAARAMTAMGLREVWSGQRLVGTIHPAAADDEPSAACWL